MKYQRITVNPKQMGGVPCIRGMRMPVATILRMVAEGMTTEAILANHPELEPADLREAIDFAAEAVDERVLPVVQSV
jgi:uncharacterized protein (DUF433 family)